MIPDLHDMSLRRRIALAFAIIVVVLLLLLTFDYLGAEAQVQRQDQVDIYADIPPDAQLIQLDRIALREAYHDQVKGLWAVWLKGQAGDPTYFKNGLLIARRAYAQALTQISRRESEIMERSK
jgi:hypothetical protein